LRLGRAIVDPLGSSKAKYEPAVVSDPGCIHDRDAALGVRRPSLNLFDSL
jgi:hypothetical protein